MTSALVLFILHHNLICKEAHQVEEIPPYLPDDSGKCCSEKLLHACWPATVGWIVLYVVQPLQVDNRQRL